MELSANSKLTQIIGAVEPLEGELKALMDARPPKREACEIKNRVTSIPRFVRIFGTHSAQNELYPIESPEAMPSLVKRCVEYAKTKFSGIEYEGATVTWFENGGDYRGLAADDDVEVDETVPSLYFIFGETRFMEIRRLYGIRAYVEALILRTQQGAAYIFGGKSQREFRHAFPRDRNCDHASVVVRVRMVASAAKKQKTEDVEEIL